MNKYYVDTSVLVAGMAECHTYHDAALPWLEVFSTGKKAGCVSNHVLAEFCATMTHLRYEFSVNASDCSDLIEAGILKVYETVHLSLSHYRAAISRLGRYGGRNGLIYDCLHVEAALAAKCNVLLTFNFRDFKRLAEGTPLKIVDAAEKRP